MTINLQIHKVTSVTVAKTEHPKRGPDDDGWEFDAYTLTFRFNDIADGESEQKLSLYCDHGKDIGLGPLADTSGLGWFFNGKPVADEDLGDYIAGVKPDGGGL